MSHNQKLHTQVVSIDRAYFGLRLIHSRNWRGWRLVSSALIGQNSNSILQWLINVLQPNRIEVLKYYNLVDIGSLIVVTNQRFFKFVWIAKRNSWKLQLILMFNLQINRYRVGVNIDKHVCYLVNEAESANYNWNEPEFFPVEIAGWNDLWNTVSTAFQKPRSENPEKREHLLRVFVNCTVQRWRWGFWNQNSWFLSAFRLQNAQIGIRQVIVKLSFMTKS